MSGFFYVREDWEKVVALTAPEHTVARVDFRGCRRLRNFQRVLIKKPTNRKSCNRVGLFCASGGRDAEARNGAKRQAAGARPFPQCARFLIRAVGLFLSGKKRSEYLNNRSGNNRQEHIDRQPGETDKPERQKPPSHRRPKEIGQIGDHDETEGEIGPDDLVEQIDQTIDG